MRKLKQNEIRVQFETEQKENVEIRVFYNNQQHLDFVIKERGESRNNIHSRNFTNLEECLNYIIDNSGYMRYLGNTKSEHMYDLTDSMKLTIFIPYKEYVEREAVVVKDGNIQQYRQKFPSTIGQDEIIENVIKALHLEKEAQAYRIRRYNQ